MTSTPTQKGDRVDDLERELHELESYEDALDQRTDNLAMRGGFTILFTFFALAIAIGAMAVAFVRTGNTTTKTVIQRVTSPAAAAPAAAAKPGTVSVKLGEFFVRPTTTSVPAGRVTFNVQNTGHVVHEMIVARAPFNTKPGADGKVSEATSAGEVSELDPGKSGSVKLNLKPGNYVLFCNVAGHYAAGQHIAFTVK